MNRKRLLGILLVVACFSVLLNYTTFSYSATYVYDTVCRQQTQPPPVDCDYTCQCECCPATAPGVMTLSDPMNDPREGEKKFLCETYTKVCRGKTVWPRVAISSQPVKTPFQPFKPAFAFYTTTETCNKGTDLACCCYDASTCLEYYSGTELPIKDEWGNITGYSTECKKYSYKNLGDGYDYTYTNSWTCKNLPNSYRCAPAYTELPRDPAAPDIQCTYLIADFERRCNQYHDGTLPAHFGSCTIKITDPVQTPCPDCAAFCASEIAAGTIVCP